MTSFLRSSNGSGLNPLGAAVLALLVLTLGYGVWMAIPIIKLRQNPPKLSQSTRDAASSQSKFIAALKTHQDQVDGRSLFHTPAPPRKEALRDSNIPTTYSGPQLIAYIGNTAWFADGQRISAAKPDGSSLRFISANPPWSIRVEWEGGEFDVELFKRPNMKELADSAKAALNASRVSPAPSSTGANALAPRPAPAEPSPAAEPSGALKTPSGTVVQPVPSPPPEAQQSQHSETPDPNKGDPNADPKPEPKPEPKPDAKSDPAAAPPAPATEPAKPEASKP